MERLIAGTVALIIATLLICFAKFMQAHGFGVSPEKPDAQYNYNYNYNYDNTNLLK